MGIQRKYVNKKTHNFFTVRNFKICNYVSFYSHSFFYSSFYGSNL